MKTIIRSVALLLAIWLMLAGCNSKSGSGGSSGAPLPGPAALPQGTPAEQATYFIALLESPETRLTGWLGLYDALSVPVLQNGAPIGSTGDDPIGIPYWQVWHSSGLDLPGQGVPLSDAGRMLASAMSDTSGTDYGSILLSDLRLAAQSSDPQAALLGLFVRERILQGPSHVDILDTTVTTDKAVIDLPTLELLSWVAVRGAIFQDAVNASAVSRRSRASLSNVVRNSPKHSAQFTISDLTCSALSNDYTQWAGWIANKVGGGLQLPGMTAASEGLPSLTKSIMDQIGLNSDLVKKMDSGMGMLNGVTTFVSFALQYLALNQTAYQVPDPYDSYSNNPGTVTFMVTYDNGNIPDGDALTACFVSYVSNAFGVSLGFPADGTPVVDAEIAIEKGQGFPSWCYKASMEAPKPTSTK